MPARTMIVRRIETTRTADLSALSSALMDAPLDPHASAELTLATFADEAVVLGAFQRASELGARTAPSSLLRRVSGGAAVHVQPGTLYIGLALRRADVLVACEPSRIVNRYVRPILKGLTRSGALATYFDRDWVSVGHRPVAIVGFAHDASSQRTAVEAFVAVRGPLVIDGARASFLGKAPGSLEEAVLGQRARAFDLAKLGDAIEAAYGAAYDVTLERVEGARDGSHTVGVADDPPWDATADEAIGAVAAGYDGAGVLRLGGELMVSRDALARLEMRLAGLAHHAPDDAVAEAIDSVLTAPGVALQGVKSLASLFDVVTRARARSRVSSPRSVPL